MFLIGNINHPNVSFFPYVLGFKIEREYPARVCICNKGSKANCKLEIQIISDCTDN